MHLGIKRFNFPGYLETEFQNPAVDGYVSLGDCTVKGACPHREWTNCPSILARTHLVDLSCGSG